jgi:glycosyltransferase involved in cell wall biosynthesis
MAAASARPAAPLWIHVTSYRFSPRSHPGVWRQVTALAAHGRQVVLEIDQRGYVATPRTPDEEAALRRLGVAVHAVARARLAEEEYAAWLAAGLRRRHGAPAALVAHLGNCGWRSLSLAAALDVPVLTVFHGSDARVGMARPEFRGRFECLRGAPGAWFAGVSRNVVADLLAFGMPPERSVLQHLGVDLAEYAAPPARAAAAGALRVAMAGRFVPFKDHRTALAAFARHRAAFPGSALHLYGEGPLEGELRAQAGLLGLADGVRFHGLVPVAALRSELALADAALQTSATDPEGHEEGLPNTVLEAMALALPVVATLHAGIPEAVVDGETGLLVPEGDAAAVARALDELARRPDWRLALGRAARHRIEVHFDARLLAARLAERLAEMRAGYLALPAAGRARAWGEAVAPLRKPAGRHGRLRRLGARLAVWHNRVAGRVGERPGPGRRAGGPCDAGGRPCDAGGGPVG